MFPSEKFPLPQMIVPYLSSHVEKDPIQLNRTYHWGLNFLRTFPRRFGYRLNIHLPFLSLIFEPTAFGLVIPDIRTDMFLKPMKYAKQFICFDILRMHNNNAFSGIGAIPPLRVVALKN